MAARRGSQEGATAAASPAVPAARPATRGVVIRETPPPAAADEREAALVARRSKGKELEVPSGRGKKRKTIVVCLPVLALRTKKRVLKMVLLLSTRVRAWMVVYHQR